MNESSSTETTKDHVIYRLNCSLGVLNTKSIKISQHNVIALLTTNGVTLMRSDNNWIESIKYRQYHKFMIPNPTKTFTHELHRIIKNKIDLFTIDERQRIYMDHTIYPTFVNCPNKGFRCLEWSYGECFNREQLFALLSLEHELWIYKPNELIYEPAINISSILLDNCTKNNRREIDCNYDLLKDLIYSVSITKLCWTEFVSFSNSSIENLNDVIQSDEINCSNDKNEKINQNKSIKKKRRLSVQSKDDQSIQSNTDNNNNINHQLVKSKKFICLLITLARNGLIYFFKINQNEDKLHCTYLNEWRSNELIVKDIYYYGSCLILCYSNGQIELIYFQIDDLENLNETNFNFTNLIKQRIILWNEEDHIEIDDLLIYELNSLIHVVFTKSTYIILNVLESIQNEVNKRRKTNSKSNDKLSNKSSNRSRKSNEKSKDCTINSIDQLIIEHNQFKIKCCSIEEGLFKMSSTGLCRLYNGDLLISSMDGKFVRIKIMPNYKLKQEFFSFNGLTNDNYSIDSLNSSSDGYLCCTISHICVYFDHLEMRDSTQITIFTTMTKKEIFNKVFELIESKDNTIEFNELYNLLEIFKVYMLNDGFGFNFKDYVHQKNLNDLLDLNLKLLRLALICEETSTTNKKSDLNTLNFPFLNEATDNDKLIEDDKSIKSFTKQKKKARKSSKEEVEEEEENSIVNDKEIVNRECSNDYVDYIAAIERELNTRYFNKLKINFDFKLTPNKSKTKRSISKEQSNLNENQIESIQLINAYLNKKELKEKCSICDGSIKFDNYRLSTCVNDHQLNRCCYSLLNCDLSKYDYKMCSFCNKSSFINPLIWPSNCRSFCLFCF